MIDGKDVSVIRQLDWDAVSLLNSAVGTLLEDYAAHIPQYLIFALEPLIPKFAIPVSYSHSNSQKRSDEIEFWEHSEENACES